MDEREMSAIEADLKLDYIEKRLSLLENRMNTIIDRVVDRFLDDAIDKVAKPIEEDQGSNVNELKKLYMSIKSLRISERARHALANDRIHYVKDLIAKSQEELFMIPNLGAVTLKEIVECLKELGFSLRKKRFDV
jgi:DNA-directed RNA polymerase alpha subunit